MLVICLFIITNIFLGDVELATGSIKTTLNFDIVMKDKVVGTLKATKKIKDDKEVYQSTTAIKTRFITEIEVEYKYDVIFEKQKLKTARVVIELNDKTHANTFTELVDNDYEMSKNDKIETVITNQINYSTILLYFKEPVNITHCYSEQDGSFNTLISNGNHSYKKINSKGKENTYYYSNGILDKANIDGGLVKFDIVSRD
ncbi:DUF6134 family protein [Aurantibacter sp.]|uniref:DUF6134 family protein n=1 Tax=Aurantibacter sp. TaxID=2807103 RepID=UPI003267E903